jgi:hypothetical protein
MMLSAPPNSPSATVDDSLEWIGTVNTFIDRPMGRLQVRVDDTQMPAPRQAEQEKETEGETKPDSDNTQPFDYTWGFNFL